MIITDILRAEKDNKLLIIGDTIIDKTIYGKAVKISPEAPVPVFMQSPNGIVETLGGASLAASYGKKNNIPLLYFSAASEKSKLLLYQAGIEYYIIKCKNNVTKSRYIDSTFDQHMLRVDNDEAIGNEKLDELKIEMFWTTIQSKIKQGNISGILMLDYCKGIFDNKEKIKELIALGKENNIPTYVDSRAKDLSKFEGVTILKLNEAEYIAACGAFNSLISNPFDLRRKMNVKNLIITKGKDGAGLYRGSEGSSSYLFKPDLDCFSGNPDVTGCGDVFDVTFCSNWCINKDEAIRALEKAVDKATEYAYQPIEERLHAYTR